MAIKTNIVLADEWHVGEDKVLTFTVRDANGAVVNITGWTLRFTMRITPTFLLVKTTASGIVITDGPNGVCTVSVESEDYTNAAGETVEANTKYDITLQRVDSTDDAMLSYGTARLGVPMV